MRHEKIDLPDEDTLPKIMAGIPFETTRSAEEDDKGPPVAVKHFHFCGRMPSRKFVRKDGGGTSGN